MIHTMELRHTAAILIPPLSLCYAKPERSTFIFIPFMPAKVREHLLIVFKLS